MQELRRASRAGLNSVTVVQLTKNAQEQEFGSGDECEGEERIHHADLSQLEGSCHNGFALDGAWMVYRSNGQKYIAPLKWRFSHENPRMKVEMKHLCHYLEGGQIKVNGEKRKNEDRKGVDPRLENLKNRKPG